MCWFFIQSRAGSSGSIDFIDTGSRKDSLTSLAGCRKKSSLSELSDCGYGTQVESIDTPEILQNTSSNEDEVPRCHQKPPSTNQKQRYNAVNNPRSAITIHDKKEWRRKKLVKRSKRSLYVEKQFDKDNVITIILMIGSICKVCCITHRREIQFQIF